MWHLFLQVGPMQYIQPPDISIVPVECFVVPVMHVRLLVPEAPRPLEPAVVRLRPEYGKRYPHHENIGMRIHQEAADPERNEVADNELNGVAVNSSEGTGSSELVVNLMDVFIEPFVGVKEPMTIEEKDFIEEEGRQGNGQQRFEGAGQYRINSKGQVSLVECIATVGDQWDHHRGVEEDVRDKLECFFRVLSTALL